MTTLDTYFNEKFGRTPQEHPAQVRDRARQEALKQRAQAHQVWRDFIDASEVEPDESLNGEVLRRVRESAGLSVGDLSDILKLSPATIEQAEAGKQSFAAGPLKRFQAVARELIASQALNHNQ